MSWCQGSAGLLLACCHGVACPGWAASLWDRELLLGRPGEWAAGWVSQCGASHHLHQLPQTP